MRATRNTPAATIVAAWISAEMGVGPGIASGSQVWKGNCADLPSAAAVSNSAGSQRSSRPKPPSLTADMIVLIRYESNRIPRTMIANSSPRSAVRVIRNALTAPSLASGSSQWCEIRKYEHAPISSQPMSSTQRSSAVTTSDIEPVKMETRAVYDG